VSGTLLSQFQTPYSKPLLRDKPCATLMPSVEEAA
jgi:hypothetical protein